MRVRNYSDADFQRVKNLLELSGLYFSPLDRRALFRKKIRHDPQSIVILEDGKKLVGVVFVIFDPWASFVYHLCIHPDYRNKRLGTLLMNEAERRLRLRGVHTATLFVEEGNYGVVRFYKKLGWTVLYKTVCMQKRF